MGKILVDGDSFNTTHDYEYTWTDGDGDEHSETRTATINGTISASSNNVFINGKPIVVVGDSVDENCSEDGSSTGSIINGSSNVFVNGKAVSREEDIYINHNGDNVNFTPSNSKVEAN